MTREEAIDLLDNLIGMVEDNHQSDYDTALQMAIKALEQQPCGNAIDRAEAIRIASGYCHPANVAKELAKLPPVTPQEPCDKCVYSTKDGYCQYDDITDTIPPFDDVISRQAVLDVIVANHTELNGVNVVMYSPLYKDIKQLQPVTPQPKVGHWIFVDRAHEHAHCSECDYGNVDLLDGRPHNYCPNCGAKMVEPQESEG